MIDREQRMDAYAFMQLLKEEGVGRQEAVLRTSLEFGIPHGTLYLWFANRFSPLGVGTLFVCPELFYVLGALLGNGCAYRWAGGNGYRVILAGDYRFTSKYAKKLSFCTGKFTKPYPNRGQNIWLASVGNCELFFLFKRIRENPNLVVKMAREGDFTKNGIEFIAGFFDAEGCVKIIKEPARKTPKICLDVTNTVFELLELVRYFLKSCLFIEAKYSSQPAYMASDGSPRKKAYHLRIYKKESVRKYLAVVGTTKLTKEKEPFVERWLSADNCNSRYARNSSLLDSSPIRSTSL